MTRAATAALVRQFRKQWPIAFGVLLLTSGTTLAQTPRTDRYGDPLPPGVIARLGTMRLRPGEKVFCLPDGKTFLSLAPEELHTVVCLWRMSTGELLRRFEVPTPHDFDEIVSADGKNLAVALYDRLGMTSRVLLWDTATGRKTAELSGISGFVRALAFAPDGSTLATTGSDQTLRLWDWRTATELRRCQGAADQWQSLAFTSDGKILASASALRRSVQLWDAATGRALRALGEGNGSISAMAFSLDGKTLAAAARNDQTIRLWDVSSGKEVRHFAGEYRTLTLAFSPDGKILAGGGMSVPNSLAALRPIYLWEVNTGRELRRLSGHVFRVTSLAFSPDGDRLVSAGGIYAMRVWDVTTGKDATPFAEHESYVESVAFSPDGRFLASAGLDGTIRLWEPKTNKPSRRIPREQPFIVGPVAFSPDGRSLAASEAGGSLRLWDVATGRPTRQVSMGEDHYSPPFAYAPDGKTLAVRHQDGTIRLLDPATGEEKRRLTAAAKYGKFLCFSPDGGKLAALSWPEGAAAQLLQLWGTATGAETRKWTFALRSGFFPMLFSPDGRFVIGGSSDPSIAIGETKRFQLHFWDVATGEERAVDAPQQATVKCLAISPDGHTLAWGDLDGTVTLWELAANQVRRRLKGHYSHIRSIAFSPDGTTLASGSADTTVLLWDVTGRPAGERAGTLSDERLRSLWDDLAGKDAAKAFDAIGLLTAAPEQAVPLLKAKLHPAPAPAEKKQIARLIADLDSERFEVRQKAMEELKQFGERAEPGLREALKDKLPLEARKRVEELLEGVAASAADPQRLRDLRAVEALEHIGTPEARQVLQTLADGAPTARLTREAKASLQRIAKRR